MQYEHNLFISYAHIDDDPVPPSDQGWVTQFQKTLEPLLSTRLGRNAKIWRDPKLQGNDVFADELVTRFNKSAALISVVSDRYLDSEWCKREAHEFCAGAKLRGGVTIDNKSRVFKVLKMPIERDDPLPPEMKQVLGYEFFTVEDDGTPLELDPSYGPKFAQAYKLKCATLAWHVAKLLKALEVEGDAGADAGKDVEPAQAAKPFVYLAECSHDRRPARDMIAAELTRLGYPVLPDKPLPTDEPGYVAAVKDMLARCTLSIHLVGEGCGLVPDGPAPKSVVMLQNDAAVEGCKNGRLERLIWLPKGTASTHALQQAFIDALNHDAQAQFGADLITGDIEELKAAIHATLKKIEQPAPPPAPGIPEGNTATSPDPGEETRQIYFICDEKDLQPSIELRKFCKQRGFDVVRPEFEGDAAAVRKANQQRLADCDAVLLYYGAGDGAWKRSIDSDLRKMSGDRKKPLLAKGTYLAGAKTADKQDLIDLEEQGLIDGLAGIPEAAMTTFLRNAGGAS